MNTTDTTTSTTPATTAPPDTTAALILTGTGYGAIVPAEAEVARDALLVTARQVLTVTTNDESADAQAVIRSLAGMRNLVEKSRKAVKEPVLAVGKKIDELAKSFLASVEAEETRIRDMVGKHAAEVARIKAEKEDAERRSFEESRRAKEEAERAAAAIANATKISDIIAARAAEKAAEEERQASLAARMDASAEVAQTKVAEGVRFVIDYEVRDMAALVANRIDLVTIIDRRSAILDELKAIAARNLDPAEYGDAIGLRVFKRPVVASR